MTRFVLFLISSLGCVYSAQAASIAAPEIGTPQQRREAISACGRDARLYCRELRASDGAFAYLACLEQHRSQLNSSCVGLLARYGQ
jgi:hypothetical protein